MHCGLNSCLHSTSSLKVKRTAHFYRPATRHLRQQMVRASFVFHRIIFKPSFVFVFQRLAFHNTITSSQPWLKALHRLDKHRKAGALLAARQTMSHYQHTVPRQRPDYDRDTDRCGQQSQWSSNAPPSAPRSAQRSPHPVGRTKHDQHSA
jgi:hypothetical protein